MAVYHFSAKTVSRSAGRSSTAAAAYRAAARIVDERTGEIHDYTRKGGVVDSQVILPGGGTMARAELWNAVEAKHKRGDATVAREFVLALADELNPAQRQDLARSYARELADRYGVAVDVNVHAPGKEGDPRNHHAHILLSACYCSTDGNMGKKAVELDPIHCQRHGLANVVERERERWEHLSNAALERAGQDVRIDHRSLQDQGITDRVPTVHLGPAAAGIERRGDVSQITERERQKVAQVIAQAQADAAIQAAAERDVQELEAQLARVLDDQADPKAHAQRLRREILDYQAEHMAGPSDRLRQASDALHRAHRRELVEPAHRAVKAAKAAMQRPKRAVEALTAEIEALPWWRPLKRRQLAKKRQDDLAQLLTLQAVIDKNESMARSPVRERCAEALEAAQIELATVQPGLDVLQHELDQVESGIKLDQAARQAEAERLREAVRVRQAQEQAKEYAQAAAAWRASPEYAREQRELARAAQERDRDRDRDRDHGPSM